MLLSQSLIYWHRFHLTVFFLCNSAEALTDSFFNIMLLRDGKYFLISKEACQTSGPEDTWDILDWGFTQNQSSPRRGREDDLSQPIFRSPLLQHSDPPRPSLLPFGSIVCMPFSIVGVDVNSNALSLTLGPALQLIHQSFNGNDSKAANQNTIKEPHAHTHAGNMFLQFTDLRCNRVRQHFF